MDKETLAKANKLQNKIAGYSEDLATVERMLSKVSYGEPMRINYAGSILYVSDPELQRCLLTIAKVAVQVYKTRAEKELETL